MPNHDKPFPNQTYLYIRTNPLDNGAEPLPSNLEGWKSPDIVVIKPDGTRGGEAIVDQQNLVEVTVTNGGGIQANSAFVEVYVADPTTSVTPSSSSLIGSGPLTIQAWSTASLSFSWTPTVDSIGHRCLLARVSLFMPFDSFIDASVFDVLGDRHVASRNIHVIPLTNGKKSVGFGFNVGTPLNTSSEFIITAKEVNISELSKITKEYLGLRYAKNARNPLGSLSVITNPIKISKYLPISKDNEKKYRLGLIKDFLNFTISKDDNVSVKLEPNTFTPAIIIFTKNEQAELGDVHFINVFQIEVKTKKMVGGLSFIIEDC